MKRTLILTPGEAYKGMDGIEAAIKYMKMASDDYDSMIGFSPEYEPNKEDEDYYEHIRETPGKGQDLFVFYRQPIVRVQDVKSDLVSTSNLILLGSEEVDGDEFWFPYLEAIEVEGQNISDFVSAVSELYTQKNGWKLYTHEDPIKTREVDCLTDRFDKLHVLDQEEVIRLAKEKLGFDSEIVSWG